MTGAQLAVAVVNVGDGRVPGARSWMMQVEMRWRQNRAETAADEQMVLWMLNTRCTLW